MMRQQGFEMEALEVPEEAKEIRKSRWLYGEKNGGIKKLKTTIFVCNRENFRYRTIKLTEQDHSL